MSVAKSWCFTLNNWVHADLTGIENWSGIRRLVVGREVGDGGTPHLQGCVTFCGAKRLSALKKLLPRAHWEVAKNLEAAFRYCRKEDDVAIDIDNRSSSKASTADFVERAAGGATEMQLVQEFPGMMCRYPTLPSRIRNWAKEKKRSTPPTVTWIHGPTGSGKTRWVHEMETDLDSIVFQGHFILGYEFGAAVLIDDFRPPQYPFASLLKLLDRYPLVVPTKGGSCQWAPDRIYITAPYAPEQLYAGSGEDLRQLLRRIHVVKCSDELICTCNRVTGSVCNTVTASRHRP